MPLTRQISFGIAAGALASAIFLVSLQSPLVFRFLLLLVAPLPVFLAGIGAGWTSAAIAGIVGTLVIGIGFNAGAGFGFLALQAVPATVLSYLAGLHRDPPAEGNESPGQREWYPVGRLVIWSAFIASALAATSLLALGADIETLRSKLRGVVEEIATKSVADAGQKSALADLDLDVLTNVTLHLLPAATAISIMGGLLFCLWVSARISQAWGWFLRPWPDLAALTYPNWSPLCLTAALAASFLPGLLGLASGAFAGAFLFAYMLLGLAIIHFVTRGQPLRPLLLWMTYAAVVFAGIGFAVILAIIGLAEPMSPLQRNFQQKGPGGGT